MNIAAVLKNSDAVKLVKLFKLFILLEKDYVLSSFCTFCYIRVHQNFLNIVSICCCDV
jgi:hypothetical protein